MDEEPEATNKGQNRAERSQKGGTEDVPFPMGASGEEPVDISGKVKQAAKESSDKGSKSSKKN